MSLILLWTTKTGQPRSIAFDIIMAETHDYSVTVTDHPVELGISVSDNVRPDPKVFSADVYVTNTPMVTSPVGGGGEDGVWQNVKLNLPERRPNNVSDVVGLSTGALAGSISTFLGSPPPPPRDTVFVLTFPTPRDYVASVRQILEEARSEGVLFRVSTPRAEYESMALTKVTMSLSAEEGNGAPIHLEFREVRVVSVKRVPAPKLVSNKKVSNAGAQPAKAPEKKVVQSIVFRGGAGKALGLENTKPL